MKSLAESTNGTPHDGASSSCNANANLGVQCGDNIPARKKKITSDAQSVIERIKNDDLLASNKEGMNDNFAKHSAMTKCSKDKKKGVWLTARAAARVEKCALATQHQ